MKGLHPWVVAAAAIAILSSLGAPRRPAQTRPSPSALPSATGSAPCARGAIRRGSACVALPPGDDRSPPGSSARDRRLARRKPKGRDGLEALVDGRRGGIPRLPSRPEDYRAYRLPVTSLSRVYAPRESTPLDPVPRAGVLLGTEGGAPVSLVELEGQEDDAEVVLVGDLFGVTVALRQRVGEQRYLVFYGELARPGPGVVSGARLGPMGVVGFLRDEDDAVLYLEMRQEQPPAVAPTLMSQLLRPELDPLVDPRNLLPRLKP